MNRHEIADVEIADKTDGCFESLDNDRLIASDQNAPGSSFAGPVVSIHVFSIETAQSLFEVDPDGAETTGFRLSANLKNGSG